jgi:hypothetical protein
MRWRDHGVGEANLLTQFVTLLVKLVLGVAGFIFMLSLLVAGLIAGLLFVLWSLLRGRRPVLIMPRFSMPPGRQWGFPQAGTRGRQQREAEVVDIVDIKVREVVDEAKRIDRKP